MPKNGVGIVLFREVQCTYRRNKLISCIYIIYLISIFYYQDLINKLKSECKESMVEFVEVEAVLKVLKMP